jgi:hypothetical protein
MLSVHIEKVGDMAVVECEGRIVGSEAAFILRNAVTSQTDASDSVPFANRARGPLEGRSIGNHSAGA